MGGTTCDAEMKDQASGDEARDAGGSGGLLRKAAAGGAAGVANDFLMHPMDNVRARLQVSSASAFSSTASAASAAPLRSLVCTTRDLARTGGVRGFYQGFSSVAIFSMPCNAAYFCTYDAAKTELEASQQLAWLAEPLGGLVAQFSVSFLWTPYDIVKQRMMVADTGKASPALFAEFRRIASNGEMLKGLQASWITWGPFSMTYFGVFESARRRLHNHHLWEEGWGTDLVAGTVAGVAGAVVSQPADAVKTRMQVLETGRLGAGKSFMASARDVVRAGGPGLLWRGVLGRVLWIAPGTAISIAVWNGLK